jgi:hypothetical protein
MGNRVPREDAVSRLLSQCYVEVAEAERSAWVRQNLIPEALKPTATMGAPSSPPAEIRTAKAIHSRVVSFPGGKITVIPSRLSFVTEVKASRLECELKLEPNQSDYPRGFFDRPCFEVFRGCEENVGERVSGHLLWWVFGVEFKCVRRLGIPMEGSTMVVTQPKEASREPDENDLSCEVHKQAFGTGKTAWPEHMACELGANSGFAFAQLPRRRRIISRSRVERINIWGR